MISGAASTEGLAQDFDHGTRVQVHEEDGSWRDCTIYKSVESTSSRCVGSLWIDRYQLVWFCRVVMWYGEDE